MKKKSEVEKSIEILHETTQQFQKPSTQSINRLETQLSQLVSIYKNEKTLSYQSLTNSAIPNSIDLTHDSCHFGQQDSISAHPPELVQTLNPIDILASYPFPEIELEHKYDPELQLGNSISLSDSILTEVFLPEFRPFPESVLDSVPVHCEIESPIFYDHHFELDQFHTFESPIDKLASSHFYGIELNEKCDLDS